MNKQANPTLFIPVNHTIRAQKSLSHSMKTLNSINPIDKTLISKSSSLDVQHLMLASQYPTFKDMSCKLEKKNEEDIDISTIINSGADYGLLPLQRKSAHFLIGKKNSYKALDGPIKFILNKNILVTGTRM